MSHPCFKCGINSTDVWYCTNCFATLADDNDSDDDDIKQHPAVNPGNQFLNESIDKKQRYSQYVSFGNYADPNINVDDSVVVDDPHFVLTLSNLNEFSNDTEIDKLKELKRCITNNQWRSNPIFDNIRTKLGNVYNVDPQRVVINDIFYGTTNIGYLIVDYLKKGVQKLIKNAKEFMQKMNMAFKDFKELIIIPPTKSVTESKDGSYHLVKSYHVSCASSKPCSTWDCSLEDHNLGGVVLYMKDGKTDWHCNNRHCRIGYIIVKPIKNVDNISSGVGAIHGKVYKSVFNEDPYKVVGSGFARRDGKWKWNSGSFNNHNDEWHNNDKIKCQKDYNVETKTMSDIEREWIEKAVRNWHDTGKQNINVEDSIVIFKD